MVVMFGYLPMSSIPFSEFQILTNCTQSQAASLPLQANEDATREVKKTLDVEQSLIVSTDGTNVLNLNEVDWDCPDDPHDPRNWPAWRRAMVVGMITSVVFST